MTETRDPVEQLGRLKRHLEAKLDDRDVERLVRGGTELRQRRRLRRSLAVGLVLGAATTLLVALVLRWSSWGSAFELARKAAPPAAVSAAASAAPARRALEAFTLRDESRAVALEPGTELAVEEDAPKRVHLRLDRGRARFEVTRRPARAFSVRAGNVTVSVIGTIFGVEVVADRVGVSVERGAVEVDWGVGRQRLLAGERGWFPPLVLRDHPEPAPPERPEARSSGSPVVPANPVEPEAAAQAAVSPAQALLVEVDAARSQGQPARAVELLRRILRDHPDDPRAPLAAFTLGRILLNELGRPREAAAAFNTVRTKAPSSQFAEDALAREIEAWSRAPEPERARSLAKIYLERYPSGRHAPRVKALSGLP